MIVDSLDLAPHAGLAQRCPLCGSRSLPIDVVQRSGEPFASCGDVGEYLDVDFRCENPGCSDDRHGIVIIDDYHRVRVTLGESASTPEGRTRIAEAMATADAGDLASAAALAAAMRTDIGSRHAFEQEYREVFSRQFPDSLARAVQRVELESLGA